MSEKKATRRELLRPLHLLGIAAGAGLFAAVVTAISTGAFTERVGEALAAGAYEGMPPVVLGLVVGGIAFIATLLVLSILLLAVNPADVTRRIDRPVLLPGEAPETPDATGTASSD